MCFLGNGPCSFFSSPQNRQANSDTFIANLNIRASDELSDVSLRFIAKGTTQQLRRRSRDHLLASFTEHEFTVRCSQRSVTPAAVLLSSVERDGHAAQARRRCELVGSKR